MLSQITLKLDKFCCVKLCWFLPSKLFFVPLLLHQTQFPHILFESVSWDCSHLCETCARSRHWTWTIKFNFVVWNSRFNKVDFIPFFNSVGYSSCLCMNSGNSAFIYTNFGSTTFSNKMIRQVFDTNSVIDRNFRCIIFFYLCCKLRCRLRAPVICYKFSHIWSVHSWLSPKSGPSLLSIMK